MADRTLRIDIQVDDKGAVQAIKRVDDALDRAGAAAKGVSPYLDRINVLAQQFGGSKLTTEARAVAQAVAELGGASKLTANEQVRINALMTEAAAKYKALGQAVPGLIVDTQKATAGTEKLGGAMQKTSGFTTGLTSMIMRFAGPMAIGFAIQRTMAWADQLEDVSRASGIGIEQLQRLRYAAEQNGLGFERMTRGIGQLQDRIAGQDRSALAALKKFGLEAQAFTALKTDEQILALANNLGRFEDTAKRTQALKDLFGREAMIWAATLDNLNEKMAAAPVATEEAVKALSELDDLWKTVKTTGMVLIADTLSPIAKAFRDIKGAINEAIEATRRWLNLPKLSMPSGVGLTIPQPDWARQRELLKERELDRVLAGLGLGMLTPEQRKAALAILAGETPEVPGAPAKGYGFPQVGAPLPTAEQYMRSEAQIAWEKEVAALREEMYGTVAIEQARKMIAAVGGVAKISDLSVKAQDRLRNALESAAEMAGTRFPRDLKRFQEAIVLASSALQVSQLTRAPMSVEGWPGLTEWAMAQPGYEQVGRLPSTDLSGMLYNLPGAYLGNMQAGQLIVKRQTEDFAKIFNASLDDLSRAFAELAQVADGDMAKAARAIGTVISTMRIASQAAASTREILWNAETGTWQAPQGAGQYAQLAANTVAMYAAMQQATGSTSRAQNIWSGAGTGAQIGGGIVPGWGHLIGAGLGALWGGLSRAPEQAAKDLRDAFVSAAGGLAALNAKAVAAGITLQGLLSQTDVEGVQWHIDDINRRLGEFAKRLQDAALPLARIGAAGGLLGPYEIRALVRDATQPEVRAALEAFFVSETQRGIKGLTQWTGALRLDELRAARQALTAAETRGVISEIEAAETKLSEIQAAIRQGISAATAPGLTGATVAYWRGLEAQGLSLVEILDALGPQITAIQEGFTLAGISGGAAFDAIARVVMATGDPAVRSILETVTGINAVLETLFNMGQLTQETFGGLLAGVMEQYEDLIRLGQAPEEARRLLRQPLQTIWQLQQTYTFTVDEATQRLLDEALAAKEVGETFRPAADRMVTAIDNLIAKLQGFIDVLLGVSGADEPPPAPPELPPKIAPREPSPWYGEPWPELPPLEGDPFGHAGGLVTPQGIKRWHTGGLASDEVPAILQMGELILSRRETQVLGRLAAGGSALNPAALERAVRAGMVAAMREQKPPVVNLDGRQVSRPLVRRIPEVLASYGRR